MLPFGEGNGSPLQYSCLENPMDRGAWEGMVHRILKSQTRLKRFSTQHYVTFRCHVSEAPPGWGSFSDFLVFDDFDSFEEQWSDIS